MKEKKLSTTTKKDNRSRRDAFNARFQAFIGGREKTFLAIMFSICLLSFGGLLYNRFYNTNVKNYTFSEIVVEITELPTETIGSSSQPSLIELFDQIQKDEKGLDLIEELQYELTKEKLDTIYIKTLYKKLKSHNK